MKTIINIKSDNEEIYFSTAPQMTKELEETIAIATQDLKANKNVSPTFSNKKDLNAYLASL